jgi:hypothetical protein
LRNTNEGFNGYVKDPDHEALDKPGRRRLHGVAAQSVATAVLLMAANVRKIRIFLGQKATQLTTPTGRRPRRRRSDPLYRWQPQVGAPASTSDPPLIA